MPREPARSSRNAGHIEILLVDPAETDDVVGLLGGAPRSTIKVREK